MCGRYNTRHVALKVAYLGWDYQGFVVQEDTERTIEAALFDALLRTRLVESRYQTLCFLFMDYLWSATGMYLQTNTEINALCHAAFVPFK